MPLAAALLAACAAAPPRVGADRDAHGCRASAGYLWCARTAACERPWELAARESLEGAQAAAGWCAGAAQATPNR